MLLTSLVLGGAAYSLFRNRRKKNKRNKRRHPLRVLPHPKASGSLSPAEEAARKQQKVSLGALVFSVLGTVSYPVISLGAVPLLAYSYLVILRDLREAIRNKKYLLVTAFDATTATMAILLSPFIVVAFLLVVLATARRLVALTERQTQADFSRAFGELSNVVWLWREDMEIETPLSSLQKDDVIVVHTGEMVPVDGCVVAGEGMLDQHLLTGEFQPVEKKAGDSVFTSTLLLSGSLRIRVEKQGAETITGQIAQTLEHAADFKQQLQSRGDYIVAKGARRTLFACGTALPFMGLGSVIALSYSGFGYQMRAAAPLMVFNYLHIAAQNGVLIKDGRALDKLHKVDTVVFDKTGTLTEEIPRITQVLTCGKLTERRLLQYAASIEQYQKHPVGLAICHHAQQQGVPLLELRHSDYEIGHGLRAELIDPDHHCPQVILIGSQRFIKTAGIAVPESIESLQTEAGERGHSVVYVATDEGELLGALELGPVLRPQALETVQTLHNLSIETTIISGDQELPTRNLAKALGIDHYFAETLPEEKANIVARLQAEGRTVCFMGDGINDSVALQQADVSISLHGAATIAQDTADIVLMQADLQHLPSLIRMSKGLHRGMNRSEWMNTAFGVTCVSGVVMFGMGLGGAMLLYTGGMIASMSNAMLPRLTQKRMD